MLGGVRVWAVVVPLLAGLFAMHGVQAASGDAHTVPMAAVSMGHARAMPAAHTGASDGHHVGGPREPSAGPEWDAAAMSGHGAMMCLALLVLLAFALVMTRAPWLARLRAVLRGVRPPRARDRRPERGPPVYLRLCVFRL
jgi:hypothetical protein